MFAPKYHFESFIDTYELRFMQTRDAQAIADFYAKNLHLIQKWEPKRHKSITEKSHWKRKIKIALDLQDKEEAFSFVLVKEKQVFAVIHLFAITRGSFDAGRISYALDADVQGQGLMHKALADILSFTFTQLKLHQVLAAYMPSNTKSEATLKRLNFKDIGLAPKYLEINGNWEDHMLTQLLNPFN